MNKKKTWNFAIVEPNYIVCAGLARIFARTAFKEQIECANMAQLWELIEKGQEVDLFLIDVGQNICRFKADVEKLKTQFPKSFVVLMADSVEEAVVTQAIQAGVHGLIDKGMRVEAMVKSLELVLLGEPVFPPPAPVKTSLITKEYVLQKHNENNGHNGHSTHIISLAPNLSSREIEVLMSLSQGNSNKEIARKLEISDATVKVHVKAILRKLRIKNRTEAALWATGAGQQTSPYQQ